MTACSLLLCFPLAGHGDSQPFWIPAWTNPRLEGHFPYMFEADMPAKAVAAEAAYVLRSCILASIVAE